ncbi:MAG: 16S rRNA (adenine(1518)-N(6)/adenine(1519)-N(6))-dimethyltransferase RsmA [Clostridia bacterium]|nr:16S rRNA (adenine(1518)-N(6)/adenine(1519)-N(6))-dimethyltransferase RsmA [Clostridia bacterium]
MRLSDINVIRELLGRHGFRFSKALGQNFLINPSVCPRMAEMGGAAPGVGVLEIGPGIGVLTVELAQRADKVVAVELDDRLLPVLAETLADYPNAKVIHGDAMKLDLGQIIAEEFAGLDVAICANLPYYITSPIIMKLLEDKLPVRSITVMVQKEAADRICAAPGTRESGALSLGVSYYADPEILFKVSRGSFMPAPNVDSAVIRLNVRPPQYAPRSEKQLFGLIKAAFGQRRKTLMNALSSKALPKDVLAAAMAEVGLSPTARAEELTMDQFVRLSDALPEGCVAPR